MLVIEMLPPFPNEIRASLVCVFVVSGGKGFVIPILECNSKFVRGVGE